MKDNIKNVQEVLSKLPIVDASIFVMKPKDKIDIEYAKSIIGHLVYFDWQHNGLIENISGKVLDLKDDVLTIYTNYNLMLDEDLNSNDDFDNNLHIQNISISDISNVFEFKEYKKMGWETIPENYNGKIYEITNMQGNAITALAYNCDTNLYMAIRCNNSGNIEIKKLKYPVSLIKSMKEISVNNS